MYTGALKESTSWENYTWSFKAFKKWKQDFLKKYNEMYWRSFKSDVPDSHDRERIYKTVLWFSPETDIFETGRHSNTVDIDSEIYENAQRISSIIFNS